MSSPVITFKDVEKVSSIIKILKETNHNGFPTICSEYKNFNGLILRNTLVVMLEKQKWVEIEAENSLQARNFIDMEGNEDYNKEVIDY